MQDLTLSNLLQILQIATIAGGGIYALTKVTTKFALLHADLAFFKSGLVDVKAEVTGMKSEMRKVNEILANSREQERRIGRLEDDLHDLARGTGWVTGAKRETVNGLYPPNVAPAPDPL